MRTRTAVLAATLAAVLLAGCSGGSSSPAPTAEPSPSASAGPTATGVPTAVPLTPSGPPAATGATSAVPFPADTRPDTGQASGGLLGLKAVRAARQDGFDRVVFELAGDGVPGWRVEYVDHPTADGSGRPVAVAGSAYLRVVLTDVGYPADTGVPEPTPRRFSPAGTAVVQQVVLGGPFEGYDTSFLGLRSRQPFRAFRLSGPPRVVVDVRHS